MRINGFVLITILILLLAPGICKAQPSSTVKYLMNTPVSLWDYGRLRLKEEIEQRFDEVFQEESKVINPIIDYNLDKNRIRIISGSIKVHENEETAKKKCVLIISIIKSVLDINQLREKLPPHLRPSTLSSYFFYGGYSDESKPDNLSQELENMTEIEVMVGYSEGKKLIQITAKCGLLEPDIFYAVTSEHEL